MKKDFKIQNPALQFITITSPEAELKQEAFKKEVNTQAVKDPTKPNYLYPETKSKRLNSLIKPSIHAKILDHAKAKNESFNETLNRILEEYIERTGL